MKNRFFYFIHWIICHSSPLLLGHYLCDLMTLSICPMFVNPNNYITIHPSILCSFLLTLILSLLNYFCCFSSSLTGYGGAAGGGGGNVATAGQGGGGASRGGPVSQVRNVIISSRLLPILLTFLTSFLRSDLLFFLLTFLVPLLPSYLPHFLPSSLLPSILPTYHIHPVTMRASFTLRLIP